MSSYLPMATSVYTMLALAGFVTGLLVRRRVGPRAVAGALACLATALASAPIWAMPLVHFGDASIIALALVWIWVPILQFAALALFILASMSRFRRATPRPHVM